MNILVLGGAGELGSNFSKLALDMGHQVTVLDIVRFYEAWRLKELGIADQVNYVWRSTFDLAERDFTPIPKQFPGEMSSYDLILDCACQADRPLGTSSPKHTVYNNLLGSLNLLECFRNNVGRKPLIIYPSSSVEFLGVPKEEQPITEKSHPKPTNVYGLTKWMTEELYLTYYRTFQMPCLIIRTGSCYGPMMRTDQFIAQCIIKCLRNEDMTVRSPQATRTYTYTCDVLDFYKRLLKKYEDDPFSLHGLIIGNGGNAENKPYATLEVAKMIQKITDSKNHLYEGGYEAGEETSGEPVFQWEKTELAEKLLGWKPKHTLKEGLKETIDWYRSRPVSLTGLESVVSKETSPIYKG